jgi:hypothetical protein
MKATKLNLKFYQAQTEVNLNFEINSDASDNLIVGTTLNELFTMCDNYREAGLRLFKSNEAILFRISSDNIPLVDIGTCSKRIQEKLKLNKTAKSKRSFSKRVNLAIKEISRGIELIDMKELENKLNAIID